MGKILVVEDDRDIREGLVEYLGLEGFDVDSVANGREALDYLDRVEGAACPAVILLDLMMPVMDGRQFRELQLAHPRHSAIPVVLMSADNTVKGKSEQLGTASYLRKPIDLDALIGAMKSFV